MTAQQITPTTLPSKFVLSAVEFSLCLDTVSACMGVGHFAVAGPTAWNSLSDDLCDPTLSTESFRRLLKT